MYSKQLADQWKQFIVGQNHAIDKIVPYIVRYKAGLNAAAHPIGNFFLLGPTGTGKALPLDELVATPTGFVPMKDITAGSFVLGSGGTPTYVEAVYPQGVVDIYKISFADGREVECCNEHLWKVYNKHWEPRPTYKVFSLQEIQKFILSGKELYVPLCQPACLPEYPLIIDPYLLGCLLGDGSLGGENSKSLGFTNTNPETICRVGNLLTDHGAGLVNYSSDAGSCEYGISLLNNTYTEDRYAIRYQLRKLGLFGKTSYNKFIPSEYFNGSFSQRLEILQGLMDTDGTVDKKTGSVSFSSTSRLLAEGVQKLVWSFGGIAKLEPIQKSYSYKGETRLGAPAYQVYIRYPEPQTLFLMNEKRKKAARNVQYQNRLRLQIKSVEYVGKKPAQCITVSAPDALYLVRNYVVTHNTRTAETLAEVLHNDDKKVLKIDCGEYHLEHETAKLIGAPPGYLGHKDTQPLLSQARINAVASDKCDISIILFDEIEKAHVSFWRLLLGLLDKANMRLGDNQVVSFEKSIVFLSSNIGAGEMNDMLLHRWGFPMTTTADVDHAIIEKIGAKQLQKKFPPEFPNRIDETITYHVLEHPDLLAITALEIKKVQNQILHKLGVRTFNLVYGRDVIEFLTKEGTSVQYGAREIKRTITRHLWNPLSDQFVDEKIKPGCYVKCRVENEKITWDIQESPFVIGADGKVTFNEDPESDTSGQCIVCGSENPQKCCDQPEDCPYN